MSYKPQTDATYSFNINFGGDSEIFADSLCTSLNSLTTILSEIALSNLNTPVRIKVTSTREGSFEIDLQMIVTQMVPTALLLNPESLKTCYKVLLEILKLKKFLKGQPPKQITEISGSTNCTVVNENGQKHITNNIVMNFTFNNPTIDNSVVDMFSKLKEDATREDVSFSSEQKNDLTLDKTEFKDLIVPQGTFEQIDKNTRQITSRTKLKIRKAAYEGSSQWDFSQTTKFPATMNDKEWLTKFQTNVLQALPGSYLDVDLVKEIALDKNGDLDYTKPVKYYIKKVYAVIPPANTDNMSFA